MLLKYFVTATLKNSRIWALGIMQMLVWLFLIAFVFSQGVTGTYNEILPGISVWYGYIALASFSTLAVVLASTTLYSNFSLAYCFKFTKLSQKSYIIDLLGSFSILAIFLSSIHLIATCIIFSFRFNLSLIPINPIGAIIVSILAGCFMMDFGLLLSLIAINYSGLQSVGVMNFIPIMSTIVFGLSQIFTKLPEPLLIISPFNEIESLLFQGYSNQTPHQQLMDMSTKTLSWEFLLLLLLIWIAVLTISNVFLLNHLNPRNIEEARPI